MSSINRLFMANLVDESGCRRGRLDAELLYGLFLFLGRQVCHIY